MKGRIFQTAVVVVLLVRSYVTQASTVTYVYADSQGTPLAEADGDGNITATFDYRPYGAPALGAPRSGPGYTGHVDDPDSRLVYMQARYYDPDLGRFISPDPVEVGVGGRYTYVTNNPIIRIDPDGRQEASDQCDIECKRARQRERESKENSPYAGGALSHSRPVESISGSATASREPYFHVYDGAYSLCSTGQQWCTLDNGYSALLHYAFPGQDPSTSATNGQVSEISFLGISGGHIQTLLDPAKFALTNVTLPDHIFYSGYVTRRLEVRNTTLMLLTHGEGGNAGVISWGLNNLTWRPGFYSKNEDIRFLMVQGWLERQK